MRGIGLVAIAMITFGLSTAILPRANSGEGGSVIGKVVFGSAPFQPAHLFLLNLSTFVNQTMMTESNGMFSFSGLSSGRYIVVAADPQTKSCLVPAFSQLQVSAPNTTNVILRLVLDREHPKCLEPVQ